jgi:hypothetical protein
MLSRAMPLAQVRRRSCTRHDGMSAGNNESRRRFALLNPLAGVVPLVLNAKSDCAMRGSGHERAQARASQPDSVEAAATEFIERHYHRLDAFACPRRRQ